jgi:type IV pilus biogenesis protein CpaD/CtpE
MNSLKTLLFGAIVMTLAACTGRAARVESDYGNSVNNMIEAQMYDPEAARNPSADLPGGLDGAKADHAIEAYRNPPKPGGAASKTAGSR